MLRILFRSLFTGFLEIWSHKLRSTLSFFGVFIGVLCIMTVFASVDSLERNISGSINSLGNDVVYVQKWPWDFGEGYPQRAEPPKSMKKNTFHPPTHPIFPSYLLLKSLKISKPSQHGAPWTALILLVCLRI